MFYVLPLLLSLAFSPGSEEIRSIPVAEGLASHPVNGGRCLVSDGAFQYLAFYDGDHRLTLAKRRLGEEEWDFARLPEKVGWDTHNKVLLFLDRDNHLHLTANMHCNPLRYYRTEKPGDIHSFQGLHQWTGRLENRVTYPFHFRLKDGSSHIMFRHGGSGNGMRLLVHYDEESKKWNGIGGPFLSGMNRKPTCNAYPFGGVVVDSYDTLHVAWCWRETPDVRTNFDLCYAKSLDKGRTWQRSDGTKCDLPIRPETAEVVDAVPQDHGLMNGGSLVVDEEGAPYIGYTRFDGDGNNQMYIAARIEDRWNTIKLTDWKDRFWFEGWGTIPEYPPIPRLRYLGGCSIELRFSKGGRNPESGIIVLNSEKLLAMKPGEYSLQKASKEGPGLSHVRAVNEGPLPKGEIHYMQQEVDGPNRDRKPEKPRPPTMIYIVEVTTE